MRSSVSSSSFCLFPFWFSLLLLALPRLVLIRNFLAKISYPSPRTLFVHRHCVRRPSWYFEEISKTKRNRLFSQLPPFYSKPAIRISFASPSHEKRLLFTRNVFVTICSGSYCASISSAITFESSRATASTASNQGPYGHRSSLSSRTFGEHRAFPIRFLALYQSRFLISLPCLHIPLFLRNKIQLIY